MPGEATWPGPGLPPERPAVLLLDEEPEVARTVAHILRQEQYEVAVAADAAAALRALEGRPFDVLLTELNLTGWDGPLLLTEVRRRSPTTYCVVLTGYASLESAVTALRQGAYDFLVKPCVLEDLKQTVGRAVAQRRLGLLAGRREQELKELNDQLEERVRARTAELTQANQRLAEANVAKDRFLATLSHELRTPLTPLRVGIDLLEMRVRDLRSGACADPRALGEELGQVVETMARNLDQEARLIDDLLDVARIDAGKLSLEKRSVDLGACLRAAADMLQPRAAAKAQALTVDLRTPIPTLLADPVRLQQIVANLLDNAVKFTPAGGRVALSAWRTEGWAHVEVLDSGPGIDPDFLPHIFEPFRQADSSFRRQHGGTGLGLAIARQLARLHDGDLQAANVAPPAGPGACFTFRFPLVPARPDAAPPAAAPRPPQPLRVLLVDDSLDTIQVLGWLLGAKGLHVRQAISVAQALQAVRAEVPDVIITDIGMPGQDGYDLLRLVRADARLVRVPVVAATGYVGRKEQEQMAHAGFAAALSKPFDLTELLRVLERVVPTR
jgi:signal transduction histidine kinase